MKTKRIRLESARWAPDRPAHFRFDVRLHGVPGVASLAGLIISHVIVLFDFIEEMRHKGEPLRKAVVDAGLARLRPVVVTVLACVGGLIPLALSGGPLWEPMCYVQIVGMLVATVVTLVLVPVLYANFVEDLHLVRWEQDSPDHAPPSESLKASDTITKPVLVHS